MSRKGIRSPRNLPDVDTTWQPRDPSRCTKHVFTVKAVRPRRAHMGIMVWEVYFACSKVELNEFHENFVPATEEAFGFQQLLELGPK